MRRCSSLLCRPSTSSVQLLGFDRQVVLVRRKENKVGSLMQDSVSIPVSWLKHNDISRRSAHHGQRTDTLEQIVADAPTIDSFIKRAFIQGNQLHVRLREPGTDSSSSSSTTPSKVTAAQVLDAAPEPKHPQQSAIVSPKESEVVADENEPDSTRLLKVSLNDIATYGMRPKSGVDIVSPFGLQQQSSASSAAAHRVVGDKSTDLVETSCEDSLDDVRGPSEAQFLHVRYSDLIDPSTGTARYLQVVGQSTTNIDDSVLQERKKTLRTLLSVLRTLTTSGLCFVDECPAGVTDDRIVRQLAYALAPTTGVCRTLYGETWSLESKPIVENGATVKRNVGFTAEKLDLHQDLVYFESMPGIQVMHCQVFEPTVTGGESFYVDAVAAADELRQTDPEAFEILSTIPSAWMKDDPTRAPPAEYYFSSPMISTDRADNAISVLAKKLGIQYASKSSDPITKVIWAPAFEAPLPLTTASGVLPRELVDAYYDAYRKYAAVLQRHKETPGCRAWFKCRAGQTVLFNNARLLHGREGFSEMKAGSRRFKGAYINIDDFLCALRAHETAFEQLTAPVVPLVEKSRGPYLNQSERF